MLSNKLNFYSVDGNKGTILPVPVWLVNRLKDNGVSLSKLVDGSVADILSTRDIIFHTASVVDTDGGMTLPCSIHAIIDASLSPWANTEALETIDGTSFALLEQELDILTKRLGSRELARYTLAITGPDIDPITEVCSGVAYEVIHEGNTLILAYGPKGLNARSKPTEDVFTEVFHYISKISDVATAMQTTIYQQLILGKGKYSM